ncbi:MAG: tRNA uridine-5-carboxymethylaminomethyl(34) synthesis GTPase MnmE, partial [Rikenellaceae bacterium]
MAERDIIVAPATPSGGAIAIIRVSGKGSIELCDKLFIASSRRSLLEAKGQTLHYGQVRDGERIIDDVLLSLFRAPASYTGEDSVEISCHGSSYITQEIINLTLRHGARIAEGGEFTMRAYLSGKMDLSQAEAVADIIAASSAAAHAMATTQMRGGYSEALASLRGELIRLSTLLELELDFSDEDVEFADRSELLSLIDHIAGEIKSLAESFALGNAIKSGVAVAIVGRPNAGKSTLLNRLLREDRAMVSDIAGTTRDVIEECINYDGITFRFIDTAGIHATEDRLEQMGIDRTMRAMGGAQIIVQLIDGSDVEALTNFTPIDHSPSQRLLIVVNKIDLLSSDLSFDNLTSLSPINISAKDGNGIERLLKALSETIDRSAIFNGSPIVSSARHYNHLCDALASLLASKIALQNNIPTDLLCEDLRQVVHHIGEITGTITTDEILGSIFSGFCIG